MAANLGAHEVMEMHEVLNHAINSINQFQMYQPLVQDMQLKQMLEHQLQFMTNEYNNMVQMLQNQGGGQAVPYRAPMQSPPKYGLQNPPPQSPNASANQLDDRDISSAMLGCHKSSALMKMIGALECANPDLRRSLQQGAVNCAEQAYEVWQYMNQKGYYQVPTMKEMTTQTMMNSYQNAAAGQAAAMQANVAMNASEQMNQPRPYSH